MLQKIQQKSKLIQKINLFFFNETVIHDSDFCWWYGVYAFGIVAILFQLKILF